MKEFEEIYKYIKNYFVNLGYAETMFEKDTTFPNQYSNVAKADFIVKRENSPFIVVEAKSTKKFENIDNEKLKFDPSVRQVQAYAMSLDAPYYVVTNGDSFLWFETAEDGRPCKIEPIHYAPVNTTNSSSISLNEAFNYCRDFLKRDARTSDTIYELILILLARFAVKDSVAPQEIKYQINRILNSYYDCDIELISQVDERVLEKCWDILSECKPENAKPQQIINTLKLFSQKIKDQKSIFRLGEGLSKFLVRLAMIDDGSVILDPVANLGEIPSEIILQNKNNIAYAYCQSKEMYVLNLLQHQIINEHTQNVRLITYEDFIVGAYYKQKSISPDRIITALPFGKRDNLYELRNLMPIDLTNIEDFMFVSSLQMLNSSGRLVAIVPDSMLFAGGKRESLRKYITNQFCLRGVISLPVGAVSNSNAKTSIVIIDKLPQGTSNVFFAIAKDTEINPDFNYPETDNASNNLLKAYEQFINNDSVEESDYWKISQIDYNAGNLRAETYLIISDLKIESDYPLYSINAICKSIKRGTALKIEPNGDIPVLGPAAIRPNSIDASKFTLTSIGNAARIPVYAEKGSIVFNNISSYLGSAAIVESDTPAAINQHVLLLTPNIDIVMPQYLAIALNSKTVSDYILKVTTGAVIPSITLENFKKVQVPVPDLEIQQNIVSSVINIQSEIAKLEEAKKELEIKLKLVIDKLAPEEV